MSLRLLCAFVLTVYSVQEGRAQQLVGRVLDSLTGKPLPFVNILLDGDPQAGLTTDLDGQFEVIDTDFQFLEFRYVGYATKRLSQDRLELASTVKLRPVGFQLEELVVQAGENPAHRIIKKASANRKLNDPLNLPAFQYESYDKLYLTGERQEVTDRIRSPYVADSIVQPEFASVDSLLKDSTDILDTMHLFMMETVSERFYQGPGKDKTNVIASRVSGLERPNIFMLATLLQPFAFYENRIDLQNTEYLNPLSPGSTKRYLFRLEDTIYTGPDSVYVISFRPREGAAFDALRGVLYINTKRYALQYVIAEPSSEEGAIRVRIQQQYEWIDNKFWFPTRLHADMLLRNISINDYYGLGIARSYLRSIKIDQPVSKGTFNRFNLEMGDQASSKTDSFWISNRAEPINSKELETYAFIDSFSKAKNLELKLRWVMALIRGNLRFGPVEVPLNRILRYNQYEGIRLGLGLQTNENLSRWFTLEGYGGFAFGDNGLKYGASATIHASRSREIDLSASYHNEVFEVGRLQGFIRDRNSRAANIRQFLVEDMYWEEALEFGVTGRLFKYLYVKPFIKRSHLSHSSEYELITERNTTLETRKDEFYFTELGVQLRYAFRERLVKSPTEVISWGTDYPVIWLNYSRGVDWWQGESNHHLLEGKISHTAKWLHWGETQWEIRGGLSSGGTLPYYKLFSPPGFQSQATFYGVLFNFNTMPIHGYLAESYLSAGFVHNFGHFANRSFLNPDFKISLLAIHGSMRHPENHKNLEIIPLNKPYIEAGLILDKLIRIGSGGLIPSGLGVGGFYRLGPYSEPGFSDNFAARLTITF